MVLPAAYPVLVRLFILLDQNMITYAINVDSRTTSSIAAKRKRQEEDEHVS
jgi:hypothetical protein